MLPNLLYIGPDKGGSTFIHRLLDWHPEAYVPPAKDIYFFDREYGRGLAWYERFFDQANGAKVVAELSHDYLYSPDAAKRIANDLPQARPMVCPREPVGRAFSAYLYLGKHGLYDGSFEEALEDVPELVENGLYAKHLRPYVELFGRERIIVGDFALLQDDPTAFARDLFDRLSIEVRDLPEHLLGRAFPASRPRSRAVARIVKSGAIAARRAGLVTLVGRAKSNAVVNRALYRPFHEGERPRPEPATQRELQAFFREDVQALDELLGTRFVRTWGYATHETGGRPA